MKQLSTKSSQLMGLLVRLVLIAHTSQNMVMTQFKLQYAKALLQSQYANQISIQSVLGFKPQSRLQAKDAEKE